MLKRTVAICLLAALAGCTSAPVPSDPGKAWTAPDNARVPDPVWPEVRSRTTDLSKPLSLADLADMALRNSPATRVAWNNARSAAAQVEFAKGYFMPTVTASASGDRRVTSADPNSFDQDYLKYGPGLQVNYLVLNFGGGRQAAVEQALQTVYAADFAFNRAIQDTLLAVQTAYYGLVSAQAGVVAAEASVADAKTVLEAVRQRSVSGLGTDLDVLQAQAGYDQSLYVLAGAKGQVKTASAQLCQVLGLASDRPVQVAEPNSGLPTPIVTQDMQGLIDRALVRRPDIAALRAAWAAKQAAVKVAGSARWPSLYLNGGLSRSFYDTVSGKTFQDRDWSYNAGLSLQWMLFDGFQVLSARHAAAAQAESAKAQLKQAELAAGAEVWIRFHAYETSLQKVRFSEAYLQSTSASYRLALDAYTAGLKSLLDLLDAETRVAQARAQSVGARQEAFAALAGLAHALGLLEKGGPVISDSIGKDHQP